MEGEQVEGGGAPESTPETGPKMVPYARLKQTVDARDAAMAEAESLRTRLAELEGVGSQVQALQGQLAERSVDLQLAESGLTSETGRVVARAVYGTLPEEGRPSIVEWFADAGKAHTALSGFLPSASSPAPATPPAAPPAPPAAGETVVPTNANTGTRPSPPATPVTQAQVDTAAAAVRADPSTENKDKLKSLLARFRARQ